MSTQEPVQVEVVERFHLSTLVRLPFILLEAWGLMLAAPLAHEVIGLPYRHPGYWICLAFIVLTRVAATAFMTRPPTWDKRRGVQ